MSIVVRNSTRTVSSASVSIEGLFIDRKSRKGEMPEPFRATYEILVEIRNKLEKKTLTQAWSLRETDLYDFQRQLDKIDEQRVDGNFFDEEGNAAELYVQRVSFANLLEAILLINL